MRYVNLKYANPPAYGGRGGDCSTVDDEIDADLNKWLLAGVPRPLTESLASASELIRVPSMLDSWGVGASGAGGIARGAAELRLGLPR